MLATIETGGKQYNVEVGSTIKVERLVGEVGDKLEIEKVLLVGSDESDQKLGRPYIESAKVTVEILEQSRHDKVIVFKKRRRKDSKTLRGHKQYYTLVKVLEISA